MAEREAAEEMIREVKGDRTIHVLLGGDKNYDTADFVARIREAGVTPHAAQNDTNRTRAIDVRTTRLPGYEISQRKRKLVEEGFGRLKTVGLLWKTRHKGVARGGWVFTFTNAVYKLIRIGNLVGGNVWMRTERAQMVATKHLTGHRRAHRQTKTRSPLRVHSPRHAPN